MAVVVEAGEPSPIHVLSETERIVAVPLSVDTVAQIVRLLDEHLIQVADTLPCGLYAAIARHTVERHAYECTTRNCAQARIWARLKRATRPVAVHASLPA